MPTNHNRYNLILIDQFPRLGNSRVTNLCFKRVVRLQGLSRVEFAYNNSINRSTGKRPFEIVTGYKPNQPIDLIPLPIHARVSESAASFAQHVRDLHKEISQKIKLSNENYKNLANF